MSLTNFVKRLRDIMRPDTGINGDAQRIEQITWLLFLKIYDEKEEMWEFHNDSYKSIIPENLRWRNWAHDNKDGNAMTGDALLDFVNNKLFQTLKNLPIDEHTPPNQLIVRSAFSDNNNYMKNGVLLRQVINVIDELNLDAYADRHAFGEIYEEILRSLQSAGSSGEFYTPRAVTDFMAQMVAPKLGEQIADFACGTGGFLVSALKELDKQVKTPADRQTYNSSIYGVDSKPLPHLLCVTNMLLHDIDSPVIVNANSLEKNVREYREADRFDIILMNPPYGGSELESVKQNFPADLRSSETADLFMTLIMYRLKMNGRAAVIIPDGFLFGGGSKSAIKKKLVTEFNLHTIIRMPNSVFAPYTSITTNILFFDRTGMTAETWFYRLDMPEGFKNFSKTKPMKLAHFAPAIEWWNNRQAITVDGFDKARCYSAKELQEMDYNFDLCGYPHTEEEILPPYELIQKYQSDRAKLNAEIDIAMSRMDSIFLGQQLIANANSLTILMKKLAEINSSFPAMLKKSILQAAVQGKLVAQDSTEPPVETTPYDGEVPFEVPENWVWVRLSDLGQVIGGGTPKTENPAFWNNGTIPWLTPADMKNVKGKYVSCGERNITEQGLNGSSARLMPTGTIVYSSRAPIGYIAIAANPLATNQGFKSIVLKKSKMAEYLYYCLQHWTPEIQSRASGTTFKEISGSEFGKTVIPLPPLAEQKRIVAKVEQLFIEIDEGRMTQDGSSH